MRIQGSLGIIWNGRQHSEHFFTSSRLSSLLNPTYNTYSNGIRIPVCAILVVIILSYSWLFLFSPCSFPPRTCMLISFLFTPTIARGSHPQLHTFPFSPRPQFAFPQTTPVLFPPPPPSPYHHIYHTIPSFSFYVFTFCYTSTRPPVFPPLLNSTYST